MVLILILGFVLFRVLNWNIYIFVFVCFPIWVLFFFVVLSYSKKEELTEEAKEEKKGYFLKRRKFDE
jgi:positive regulator of sigma E activity